MYPHTIQFETRQMELEAQLGLYGARERLAQQELAAITEQLAEPRVGRMARLRQRFAAPQDPKRVALRSIPLFAALPRKRFDLLVRTTEVVDVPSGKTLIREGEIGHEFFAIAEGEVEISKDGKKLATEVSGDTFGEIALLFDVPRTATVRTTAPSRLFVLHEQAFHSVLALG
jgi:hypothetical protein